MFKILLVIFFIFELNSCSKNAVLAAKKQSSCSSEEGEWACKSGACILIYNLCDGTKHCRDGSDERKKTCKNMQCSTSSFRCNYGACIPAESMCDGVSDCVDSSDEDNDMCRSHRNEPTEEDIEESENRKNCASWGQMKCWSGQCVNLSDKCNGIEDCADGSDEWSQLCANIVCDKNHQFKCNYGACIDIRGMCNGTEECADKSDEALEICEMKTVLPTISSPPEFTTKISVDSKTTIIAKDNNSPGINKYPFLRYMRPSYCTNKWISSNDCCTLNGASYLCERIVPNTIVHKGCNFKQCHHICNNAMKWEQLDTGCPR